MEQELIAGKDREPEEKPPWYLRPGPVIFLLFFVAGPLALPLLFRSPAFSRMWKGVLTVLVVLYTAYLVVVSIKLGQELLFLMDELQQV